MRHFRILAVLVFLMSLTGCGAKYFMDRMAPDTTAEAKGNFDDLRHGHFDRVGAVLDPSIDRTHLQENLEKIAALVPAQEPVSVHTVGIHTQCNSGTGCNTRVILEYQFPSKWLIVDTVVHRQDGKTTITSIYVRPLSQSLEQANRFTLRGKHPQQYAVLIAAACSFAIMVFALVLCIRTPMESYKWLWIVLILLGAPRIAVNWTTGALSYQILAGLALPAWISSQIYGPWTVSVSLPLGAIAFLVMRDTLKKSRAPLSDDSRRMTVSA